MINHLGIPVSDITRSRTFYDAALAPLGISATMVAAPEQTASGGTAIGYGTRERPNVFWIGDEEQTGEGIHVAFDAKSRAEVDSFYRAALDAGGRDNGAPGLRPNYGPGYYAAFVFDPDGANIEAVFHEQ